MKTQQNDGLKIGDKVVLTTGPCNQVETLVDLEVCMFNGYPAYVPDECRRTTDKEVAQGYRDDEDTDDR